MAKNTKKDIRNRGKFQEKNRVLGSRENDDAGKRNPKSKQSTLRP